MKPLNTYKAIYFVGIGGIGMSALAQWFVQQGYAVAGYDRVGSAVTQRLEQHGVEVVFDSQVPSIPKAFCNPNSTLVVYTPAVKHSHAQLQWFCEQGFDVAKRAQVLGLLTQNHYCIAVAGTHGKTTTSSMIAHLLLQGGLPVVAFIGGVLQNYNSNFVTAASHAKPIFVVEADEFDRSFLHLHPNVLVVTNIDPDHLDIYQNEQNLIAAFEQLIGQVNPDGVVLLNQHIKLKPTHQHTKLYGSKTRAVQAQQMPWLFDFEHNNKQLKNLELHTPGQHNMSNMEAAILVALHMQMPLPTINQAVNSYRGVKRRFEVVANIHNLLFVDDYAHHPTEINALLTSLRKLTPHHKLVVVFQPHLFSRTRDFMNGFAHELSKADHVILLDVYPARELPIEGIDSHALAQKITHTPVQVVAKQDLPKAVAAAQPQTLATVGAGDIDREVEPLKNWLIKHFETKTMTT